MIVKFFRALFGAIRTFSFPLRIPSPLPCGCNPLPSPPCGCNPLPPLPSAERLSHKFSPLPSGERVRVRAVLLLAVLGLLLGGCVPKPIQPTSGVFAVIVAEPKEGQAPLTVHFDASRSLDPAGPLTDYLWDFGDGSPVASGAQLSHTFRRAGEYLVTLVVVGPSGTGRATTLIRAFNNPPKASFAVWPKDPFTDESVTFDASASSDPDGDPLRYLWDFGDGSSAEGKIVQHTYKKAGEYVVILTVSDPGGAEDRATTLLKVEECVGGGCGRRR